MPTPSLPPNPPAIVQPAPNQSQNQEQQQYLAPNINSSNSNNAGANSTTESTGVLNQSGELSNYQINNDSSNSVYSFGVGLHRPTPSLNVTAYSNGGNNGVAATLFIPLGGGALKQHERLVNSRTRSVDLDNQSIEVKNQLELASACAKILASGTSIDYNMFPALLPCKGISIVLTSPPPLPVAPQIQKLVPPVQIIEPPVTNPKLPKRPVRAMW